MKILKLSSVVVGVLSIWGCGPHISENRLVYAPPRPENCDIKVLNAPATTSAPANPEYEVLGMVSLESEPGQDPLSEELLADLRPTFCKLGGEAVSLGLSTEFGGGESGVIYNVLRKKSGAAPAAAPADTSASAP